MGDRVSKQEIDQAATIHVIDYLIAKGEPIEKQGGNYYKHSEHDSLVLHEDGKWYWNSRAKGGHGAISLAREFYSMQFQDAVRDINELNLEPSKEREIKQKEQFRYPGENEVKGIENARKYLVEERMLDTKIVSALEKHGLIAEDKMRNAIFKWVNKNGEIEGADRQGTMRIDTKRGTFKGIMANSKEDGGFQLDIGTPNKVAFFESTIDALSYFDLKRPENIRLKSMSGLKDQVVMSSIRELIRECQERGEQVEKTLFCVDNDPAGREYAKKWEHIIGEDVLDFDFSEGKDWNEDLKEKRKREKLLQQQKEYEHTKVM
ncbi:DUF3991 and TOPRIM domain-containing protein [Lysinibacillus fusiformis]|uniref:DUF3991 and TOPRIM domain-containing protein n=1 Tax=Lysinibacillus fusiformis TaxID=28031 RepID=UPI000D3B927F|nr:DUF3991 and TOPRIM domain-containing protein [Lysinibacillus fusiformis]MED4672334.1 DUF3991 and TOPRIM domain-containing protein [Lysinibacillus fusiformis]RDV25297.1 hypothetical protein C7B90_22845 [Lysinibacillus fusiformis]GED65627.1 hypothetical protein LFU01_40790 [Lysinibacillus fusiformis]